LNHSDITNGGTFNLTMSSEPNKSKGVNESDFPYSMTNELKAREKP
jgi:putative alpha-1,2-mannosidase